MIDERTGWARTYRRLEALALRVFRALPAPVRRGLVRSATPSFTVGAVAAISCGERVLALRQPHRPGWSLPGGLLARGETAAAGVAREVLEETGLRIEVGLPVTTVVAARVRRVDVVFGIEVPQCFPVTAGGEAQHAQWVTFDDLQEVDEPTRDILDALARARSPGAYGGSVRGVR